MLFFALIVCTKINLFSLNGTDAFSLYFLALLNSTIYHKFIILKRIFQFNELMPFSLLTNRPNISMLL